MSLAPDHPACLGVRILGIGIVGPGLDGWETARPLLADPSGWTPAPTPLPPPARLPPAERRRSGAIVKLSLAAAEQAVAMAGVDPATVATVFSSSSGDPANCHALCEALATPERAVSPTRFTNSVHNAPAGYWHIACSSRAPSTSLCALDASFGAGLLEAAVQCASGRRPVLLVCAEVPYPEPLAAARPMPEAFGLALLLEAADGSAGASGDRGVPVSLWLEPGDPPPTACEDGRLEALRRGVPAARGLPLLQALARGAAGNEVVIDGLSGAALRVRLDAVPHWDLPAPAASMPTDRPACAPPMPGAVRPSGCSPDAPARHAPSGSDRAADPDRAAHAVASGGSPATLDRAAIAERIPHAGTMCLLDRLEAWTAGTIDCRTASHADPNHPMRTASGLLAPCGIEYAAQAMALHGALIAQDAARTSGTTPGAPSAGYLASVRSVRLIAPRLDDAPGELRVRAERLSGDAKQVLYAFAVSDGQGRTLVDGRAVVVLDTPLPAPAGGE